MSDLSREARALIAEARPAETPEASAKVRVRAALAAQLALPPGNGPLSHASPPTPAAVSAGMGAGAKLVVLCALTATLVGGAVGLRHWGAARRAPELALPVHAPSAAPPAPVGTSKAEIPVPDDSPTTKPIRAITPPAQPRTMQVALAEHALSARKHRSASMPPAAANASRPTEPSAPPLPASSATVVAPTAISPGGAPPGMLARAPARSTAGPVANVQGSTSSEGELPSAASASDVAPTPGAHRTKTGCSAKEELRLLGAAQIALRERRARAALAMLDQHTALCPSPRFREEHSTAHILALCLLHQNERAQAEAAELATLAPSSPQLARLRTSCAAAGLDNAARDPGRR